MHTQYRSEYFIFSKDVHSTTTGMLAAEVQLHRGHVLKVVTSALLSAAGYIVQVLPTKTPQAHIDQATALLGQLTALGAE